MTLHEVIAVTPTVGLWVLGNSVVWAIIRPFEQLRSGATVAVLKRGPGRKRHASEVASSIEEFTQFVPMSVPEEDGSMP